MGEPGDMNVKYGATCHILCERCARKAKGVNMLISSGVHTSVHGACKGVIECFVADDSSTLRAIFYFCTESFILRTLAPVKARRMEPSAVGLSFHFLTCHNTQDVFTMTKNLIHCHKIGGLSIWVKSSMETLKK